MPPARSSRLGFLFALIENNGAPQGKPAQGRGPVTGEACYILRALSAMKDLAHFKTVGVRSSLAR
jgi:hypothetical protein